VQTTKSGERRFDVIVIGSGIGGLIAALTAATRGRSVLVLEAGKQFGGYLNPFKRRAFSFDPGLHYIGECGPGGHFSRLLASLGLEHAVRFHELSPEGFDRLVFPGYEVAMPRGAERYHERLAHDFPHERRGLERFFDLLRRFRSGLAAMNKARGPLSLLKAAPHLPMFLQYGRATFGDLLDEMISDPLLKAVLAGQGGDIGLPPHKASAMISLGVLDHYLGSGAYYPVGGSRALRDALVDAITRKGGVLLRNHAVQRILLRGDRVHGVHCANGEEFLANTIISNADAAYTYRELVGTASLPRRLRDKTQKTRYSVGSICLFIGTDLDITRAGMSDANIWHYPSVDIDRAYEPIFRGELPPTDIFFLSSPSLKDPDANAHAPAGHHTLELVTLAPFAPFAKWAELKTKKRGEDYERFKQELLDRYLGCVEKYVPSIRDHLTVVEVGTPATNVTYAAAPRGAIYGPDHAPDQIGPFRYGVGGALEGLFFCGSSVLGAGIVPSAISGHMAAKAATRDKTVWERYAPAFQP